MRTEELKNQQFLSLFYKPLPMASRASFSVRPLALPTYPIPQSIYENRRTKKQQFLSLFYKPLPMASRASFSVRPQALPTYPTPQSIYENPKLKNATIYIPFLTNHQQ